MLKSRLKKSGITQTALKEYINALGFKVSAAAISSYVHNPNIGSVRTGRIIEMAIKEMEGKNDGR